MILADTHCGHLFGLTPPAWQLNGIDSETPREKAGIVQRAMWEWFEQRVEALRPIDSLICNGDMIDGKGPKSGGTEQLTTARDDQCRMAEQIIEYINAKNVHMIYGTPYHVGTDEDWESIIADKIGADIGSHEWYEAEGIVIDCKHRVGGSVIPHGRHTAPAREALWKSLWAERAIQPRARIIVRSHVHYHTFCGDNTRLIMTTPCLQAHAKFGARACTGTIDLGFIIIDIKDGRFTWWPEMLGMEFMAREPRPL